MVEQFSEFDATEQLGKQGGVQRKCLCPTLGERTVPLIHERTDVVEQQRVRKGRRRRRLDLHDADLPSADLAQNLFERRQVVYVLQAFTDSLEEDGERRVLAGDVQQLGRTLTLLPQRRALSRIAPGEEQCACRAFPKARGEQGRTADLLGDDVGDLVLLEHEQIRAGWAVLGIG